LKAPLDGPALRTYSAGMERILLVEDNLDAMLAITQGLND
jgi:hypothetical protein